MIRFLFATILFFPISLYACAGYVIGFKGNEDVFDHQAFRQYVDNVGYCSKLFSWHQSKDAVTFISGLQVEYWFYGFSKGAATISDLLKRFNVKKPEYILTIGAYRTTDVNFNKYGIKHDNYFDSSGIGQRSPGTFLSVSHSEIQKEVNKVLFNDK
jgi:hypothetical protein